MDELIHVVPVNDLRQHVLAMSCWCCPIPDHECEEVILHNSMDRREEYENGRRLS